MKRKQLVSVFLSAMLVVMGVAGCSSGTGPQTETEPTTQVNGEETSSNEAAAENIQLRFMWWGNDDRHERTLKVIELYEEQNPHVQITAEYGGYDGYYEKVTTQLSGGTAPDIIQVLPQWTSDLYSSIGEAFVDLYTNDTIDYSDFDENFLESCCVYDGKLVGLPTGVNAMNFLINTAVAEEAGIDVYDGNYTWDKLIEDAKKVQEYNPEYYMVNYDLTTLGKEFIWGYLAQLTGNEMVQPDNTLGFTEEDLTKTFELIKSLYDNKVFEPVADAAAYDNARNTNPKWINHEYVGLFGVTSLTVGNYYDFKDTADVILPPMLADAKDPGMQLSPSQSISINAGSAHIDEAAKFLNFFFNDEEAAKILGDCRSIPCTNTARRICEEEGLIDPLSVKAVELLNPIATDVQNLTLPTEIATIMKDASDKVAYNQGTPAEIAAEAYAYMLEYLEGK